MIKYLNFFSFRFQLKFKIKNWKFSTNEVKCVVYGEEGGDDAKSAWPFDTLGNTRDTMAGYKGLPSREMELIPENQSQFG